MLASDPEREEAELRAYLGEAFDPAKLERWEEILDEEVAAVGDEGRLYRTSQAYLYNLTVFAQSATKLPYLEVLTQHFPPGTRVLDYGCGIGSDGLLLMEAGYDVEFADFANPSTEYLRWRLRHRGVEARVHDLDHGVPGGFDVAYAFDVIEHVPEPWRLLHAMEQRAGAVLVNLLEYEPHQQPLHYELPVAAMLRHAAVRDLIDYRLLYGSSHLLLYRTGRVDPLRRMRNRATVAYRKRASRERGAKA